MKQIVSLIFLSILLLSCTKDKETEIADYTAQNEQEIIAYLAKNNLTASKSSSGLYFIINEPGTGAQPTQSSEVTVVYKGYYSNKKTFDESSAAGETFKLNGVIKGWTEGIQYFKTGGSGILLVPAHLGYGSYDYKGIPGGSVLVFDIKLLATN